MASDKVGLKPFQEQFTVRSDEAQCNTPTCNPSFTGANVI